MRGSIYDGLKHCTSQKYTVKICNEKNYCKLIYDINQYTTEYDKFTLRGYYPYQCSVIECSEDCVISECNRNRINTCGDTKTSRVCSKTDMKIDNNENGGDDIYCIPICMTKTGQGCCGLRDIVEIIQDKKQTLVINAKGSEYKLTDR